MIGLDKRKENGCMQVGINCKLSDVEENRGSYSEAMELWDNFM